MIIYRLCVNKIITAMFSAADIYVASFESEDVI